MDNNGAAEELKWLRKEISRLDEQLLSLFAQRMEVIERVAESKKQSGAPVLNRRREAELLTGLGGPARVFVETLLRLSRQRQYELLLESQIRDVKWQLGAELKGAPLSPPIVRQVAISGTGPGENPAGYLFPSAVVVPAGSAAAALGQVVQKKAQAALLPLTKPRQAAEIYSLLAEKGLYIQAALEPPNAPHTRYIAVGPTLIAPSQEHRVSLLLHIVDQLGALAAALNIFADVGINLDKIECISRRRLSGRGCFYLEFCAPPASGAVKLALYQLEQEFPRLYLLGCYEARSLPLA